MIRTEERSTQIAPFSLADGVEELMEICELSWVDIGMGVEGPAAAALNGRLPPSALADIPGGRLKKEAAASWKAMRLHIGRKHNVWIVPAGSVSSYRTYVKQTYFWNLYRSGRGNVAAYPGTSNHGWGLAVDVKTTQMAYLIKKYARMFGWSHDEGARVGEWWHMRYVGGYKVAVKKSTLPKMSVLTPEERKQATILLRERKIAKRNGGWGGKLDPSHLKNATKARSYLESQNQAIHEEAKKTGWSRNNRRVRHTLIHHLI